jgi:staphylococcal nuclease domain-containing protein 1
MDPWGFESRECLRKSAIGKEVRVEPEYKVQIPSKDGKPEMNLDFASVILTKNSKNVCIESLEKGFLRLNLGRDDENAGPYVEDLIAAESKAKTAKKGIHSAKEAPIHQFTDLISNIQRAKAFENMMMKRHEKTLKGMVEYCFSGMKFKIRVDSESSSIAFGLNGIRTLSGDKNQPQHHEFYIKALDYAKEKLL